MKKYIATITVAILFFISAADAQGQIKGSGRGVGYDIGVHVGMDIGAAAPWPLKHTGGMNMSAVAKLSPALGGSFTMHLPKRFSLSGEVTWKQVGIDASARVAAQRFSNKKEDGTTSIVEFRGTADVKMAFSMLEVPVYIGYGFNCNKNRLYIGGYYSHVFKAEFDTTPRKGVVVNPELAVDPDPILITPENPIPDGVMPAFNDYLDNWDAGFLIGYEWQIIPRLNLTARFSMGLKDIFKPNNNYLDYKMLHMRGTVMVSYKLFRL